MRKPFDPSTLRDEITDPALGGPFPRQFGTEALAERAGPKPGTDPVKVIREIKSMLVGDEYAYADATLRGILTTIQGSGWVSEGQLRAVDNIAAKPYGNHPTLSRARRGY